MSLVKRLILITLFTLVFIIALPAAAQGVCPDDTLEVWTETEPSWLGIWTEQPDGSFISEFSRPGEEYEATLYITIDEDNNIAIDRINPRVPTYYLQGDCTYEGVLSEDGSYASGTAICEISKGQMTDLIPWEATINCGGAEPITTERSAFNLLGEAGAVYAFICAPISDANPLRRVWGTDFYTSDTSICTAAIHAGIITEAGGPVTIQLEEGLTSYFPSSRNGITSEGYAEYGRSYSFYGVDAEPILNGINWSFNVTWARDQVGAIFDYTCIEKGYPASLYGTDTYTDDSSVCTAAVHAGLITLEEGGPVTIQITGEKNEFVSTERNGLSSRAYGYWYGSYQFVGGGQ